MSTLHHPEKGKIDLSGEESALYAFAKLSDDDYLSWRYPFSSREQHMRYVIVMMLGGGKDAAMDWTERRETA